MAGEMVDPVEHFRNRLMIELQALTDANTNYESAVVTSEFPNLDVDLPLQAPVLTLSGGDFIPDPTGMGDVLSLDADGTTDIKGVEFTADLFLDIWTSRGSDEKPSPSGGQAVNQRILGLLFVDVTIKRSNIPDWIQEWTFERGRVLDYTRDEQLDYFQSRGLLKVTYEVRTSWFA